MFDLLGYKWGSSTGGTASGTISWNADDLLSDLDLDTGVTSSQMIEALRDAFETWENVAAINFVQGGSSADVTLVAKPYSDDILGEAVTGIVTTPGANGATIFNEAVQSTVYFDSSDQTWSPFGDTGSENFFAVAVHEIGHVIGLGHVSDDTQIMHDFLIATDLGSGDIEGAQTLYGTDVGDEPVSSGDAVGGGGGSVGGSDDGGGGGGGGALAILLGLFALIGGLFTGGATAVVALAGRSAGGNSNEQSNNDHDLHHQDDGHNHDGHDHESHVYEYIGLDDEPFLPMIDFKPPALLGEDEDEMEDSFFL